MSTAASSPAESQAVLEELVKSTMGALLLGLTFSAIFFGVTIIQIYQYYYRYWSDTLVSKIFVALIGTLDALQVISVIAAAWWYLIENYGNIAAVGLVPWSLALEVASTAAIGLLVQTYFAHRVWTLSKNNYIITAGIIVLTLLQFAFAVYYVVVGQTTGLASTILEITWASTASLSLSIAADVLITASLCWYLHRSRSGLARTDKLIDVLIVYTVNTGLLTTICAICTIALSQAYPTTYWDTMFYFMISKCYVNSTLATLNARDVLRKNMSQWNTSSTPVPLSALRSTQMPPKIHAQLDSPTSSQFAAAVRIDKHQFTEEV